MTSYTYKFKNWDFVLSENFGLCLRGQANEKGPNLLVGPITSYDPVSKTLFCVDEIFKIECRLIF